MPENDHIESVYSTGWINGFQCEAMGYVGHDGTAYYWAFHISPAQDEQEINWHSPVALFDDVQRHMNMLVEKWQERDDERWQEWEDNQIAEWERQGCPVAKIGKKLTDNES